MSKVIHHCTCCDPHFKLEFKSNLAECRVCKNSFDLKRCAYSGSGIEYFKHILIHYGLDVCNAFRSLDTPFWIGHNELSRIHAFSIFAKTPQMIFLCLDVDLGELKCMIDCSFYIMDSDNLWYMALDDIIKYLRSSIASCIICKTTYESFPTMDLVSSHINKVHAPIKEYDSLPSFPDLMKKMQF